MFTYTMKTGKTGFYNITQEVKDAIQKSRIQDGLCVVFSPHTTSGITINENADPDVVHDLTYAMGETFPDRAQFRHMEGNSAAHLKAGMTGSSVTVIVENGRPMLGTWQGIYFCEYDGPRSRQFWVKVIGS